MDKHAQENAKERFFGDRIPEITNVASHQRIIEMMTPNTYKPASGLMTLGRGSDSWTLTVRCPGAQEKREIIDCQSMYSANNLGHGNKAILDPIVRYLSSQYAAVSRAMDHNRHAPALKVLHDLLTASMPGTYWRVMLKCGGGEAVDTAIKAARKNHWLEHGRPKRNSRRNWPYVIVATNSFHGRMVAQTAALDIHSREGFEPLRGVIRIPYNDLSALRKTLDRHCGKVAGVLVEPIQGEGGVIIPHDNYMLGVENLCHEFDTLFMLDEVQTGFGRTGKDLACEHWGITPDIMILGKSLGGGVIPVSAVVGRKSNKRDVLACFEKGQEGATFSAYPLACVAIQAAVRELRTGKYAELAAEKGTYMLTRLQEVQDIHSGRAIREVRGKGLMIGIETTEEVCAHALSERLLEYGVWMHASKKNVIRILPPLSISYEALDEVVKAVHLALCDLTK